MMIPNSSNNQISVLLQLTIKVIEENITHYLLFLRFLCHPSEFKGDEEELLPQGNLAGKKRKNSKY